jgi:hypothetical protein
MTWEDILKEKFYYHGSDASNLSTILEKGIQPSNIESSVWFDELQDISPNPYYYKDSDDFLPSVFLTDTFKDAYLWAKEAGNNKVVVFKISSKVENLKNFSDDGSGGWRVTETIPKKYILDFKQMR